MTKAMKIVEPTTEEKTMASKVIIDTSFVNNEVIKFKWHNIDIDVKRSLPMEDAMGYINDVVAGCLDENGSYYPEAIDFMRRREFIRRYTNIELPNNTSDEYRILYGTDLYDSILDVVDGDQADSLWWAISDRINMIKNDRRDAVEKEMAELYSVIKNLTDVLQATVGDVNSEQISDFLKIVAKNDIDEKSIVSALLDEKNKRAAAEE